MSPRPPASCSCRRAVPAGRLALQRTPGRCGGGRGDSTRLETVRTRTLVEETSRVFRARVVNPRWIEAMRRHGYKGAFELAATVDHLFGYDATTGVMADRMYDRLTETYVLDPANRAFLREADPWALHGIAERLLEAESRGMWEKPDPSVLEALRQVYLETEGDLESEDRGSVRDTGRRPAGTSRRVPDTDGVWN